MCGIAGYSLDSRSRVHRTLAAQALLAAIAERGADAVGYAHRGPDTAVTVHKQRTGASALLDRIAVPDETTQTLIHVRDYTKGHPTIEANNHPVRHGAVVGVHNGIIVNDEEIFAAHGFVRSAPEMTVDSAAIFALAESSGNDAGALEELRGSMATAWIDERRRDTVYAARGVGRPLWIGFGARETFFASTEHALDVLEEYVGIRLRKREVAEGTLLSLERGRVTATRRFKPDRAFEERALPAVRAPGERIACLRRLAIIAAGL
jgi:glucosamine 6-phosphate synthetase-like amidotransferase/phosphosugar isomerase protein